VLVKAPGHVEVWAWIQNGNYLNGSNNRIFFSGNQFAALNRAGAVNGTRLEWQLYGDGHTVLLWDDVVQSTTPPAVDFPCFGNFSIGANGGFDDIRILVITYFNAKAAKSLALFGRAFLCCLNSSYADLGQNGSRVDSAAAA
jgi:hypothetical protein